MSPSKRQDGKPLIGAHCNGGLKSSVNKALEIGAQSMQIFIGSPQTWKSPEPGRDDFARFKESVAQHGLGPVFVHGNYLVNLATSSPVFLKNSLENMYAALRLADRAGAAGLIFHPGSAGSTPYEEALNKVVAGINVVLSDYEGDCRLLLEVCAGQGETIGDSFEEFKDIFEMLDHDERLGVCWDTCHLFNAGYNVATEDGLKKTIDEFEKFVGFEWLMAVHANDSKTPFASRRDRHENIGEGHIGPEAFQRMLQHPKLRHLPWILEVPGFEDKGPDKKNIDILKQLSEAPAGSVKATAAKPSRAENVRQTRIRTAQKGKAKK
jgi:deoxyribonuclease-4